MLTAIISTVVFLLVFFGGAYWLIAATGHRLAAKYPTASALIEILWRLLHDK